MSLKIKMIKNPLSGKEIVVSCVDEVEIGASNDVKIIKLDKCLTCQYKNNCICNSEKKSAAVE